MIPPRDLDVNPILLAKWECQWVWRRWGPLQSRDDFKLAHSESFYVGPLKISERGAATPNQIQANNTQGGGEFVANRKDLQRQNSPRNSSLEGYKGHAVP